jgi:hypothetical protein
VLRIRIGADPGSKGSIPISFYQCLGAGAASVGRRRGAATLRFVCPKVEPARRKWCGSTTLYAVPDSKWKKRCFSPILEENSFVRKLITISNSSFIKKNIWKSGSILWKYQDRMTPDETKISGRWKLAKKFFFIYNLCQNVFGEISE